MDQIRLIMGLVILAMFMILAISGSIILLREWNSRQTHIGGRKPLLSLDYCSSMQVKPCILSFNLDPNGNMVINLLTKSSSPDFYLKIKHNAIESIYECQKVKGSSPHVSCVGEAVALGDVLQFLMISTNEDIPFAEGRFPIIGLALATPEIYSTPTSSPPARRSPR